MHNQTLTHVVYTHEKRGRLPFPENRFSLIPLSRALPQGLNWRFCQWLWQSAIKLSFVRSLTVERWAIIMPLSKTGLPVPNGLRISQKWLSSIKFSIQHWKTWCVSLESPLQNLPVRLLKRDMSKVWKQNLDSMVYWTLYRDTPGAPRPLGQAYSKLSVFKICKLETRQRHFSSVRSAYRQLLLKFTCSVWNLQ